MSITEALMDMEFWMPLSREAQVGVFAVQVLMMLYLSLSFLKKSIILKIASTLHSWLSFRGDPSDPLMIKKRLILQLRKALAQYAVALVLWLTAICFAAFFYSGWLLSHRPDKASHFEQHTAATVLLLICQCAGAALLCVLRWKRATRFLLDLGYVIMMLFLSLATLPGVCPGEILTVFLCLVWIIRLALLPLANSMLWVILANLGCSACVRLRLHSHLLSHPDDLSAEQMLMVDMAVLTLSCVAWVLAQTAVGYHADQRMESGEIKAEGLACASLLATLCDAHFFLNKQLHFEQHERALSSILVQSSNTTDRSFAQFLATEQDQERFINATERACANQSPLAQVMHVGMRDGLGNVIPVQVFHIALFDVKGEARHLVGLREYCEHGIEIEKLNKCGESRVQRSNSAGSGSSASIDLDDNNECTIIFEPIDMEILSSSRFLMDCMGQLTSDGLCIVDLVYASDRHQFRSDLINHVNEFMASGAESIIFEMNFRMKMRWGLTVTTWRCLLSNGDMLLIRADLIRIKKRSNSKGSASRTPELGLVEELRPTVYGLDSL